MWEIFRKLFRKDTRSEQVIRLKLPKMNISEDIKREFRETFKVLMEEDKKREREGLPPRVRRYGSY